MTLVQRNNPYWGSSAIINNWGDIAVEYHTGSLSPICGCHGGRWNNGTLTDLGKLGDGDANSPSDVNNRREIIGSARSADGAWRPYLWRDGVIRDLGTFGGRSGEAVAINDRGEITGHAHTADGQDRPFLWHNGTMIDLTTLGLRPTDRVADINIWGHLVGVRDGQATPFLRS